MNSNSCKTSSLTSGMSDYLDQIELDNHYKSYHIGHYGSRGLLPSYSNIQDRHQEFANGFTLPTSSSVFRDQMYTFHDRSDNYSKLDFNTNHSIDLLQPQYPRSDYQCLQYSAITDTAQVMSEQCPLVFRNSYISQNTPANFKDINRRFQNHNTALPNLPDSYQTDSRRVLTCQPYAKLIYEALKNAPGNRMVLKDIYAWFERYTDKPQTSNRSGWKNSIRHNLSMNAAFEKIESRNDADDGKKTYIWALSNHALSVNGVESTTRYRKHTAKKPHHQTPRSRISKKTKPSTHHLKFKTELNHIKQDGTDTMVVKQEKKSQDFVTKAQENSMAWSFIARDSSIPHLTSAATYKGADMTLVNDSTKDYQLSNCLPSLTFPGPHVNHEMYDEDKTMQQTTLHVELRKSESPTPSMTTDQSPFVYHEDIEFSSQYHASQQGSEILQDSRPNKISGLTYSTMYQSELAGFDTRYC